jgi:hypothetical protein
VAGLGPRTAEGGDKDAVTTLLWYLVRLLYYTDTKSQVTLGGQSSAYFPILQGVVQGCPLSPILFNIYVDDLLSELHRAGQLHGIPSADCQDKLGGQAYADDKNALSSSNEGSQHLTTIKQRCLAEDLLLHPVVHKCQAMCFHPCEQDAAPDLHWDSQTIANATSVRFMGLHPEPDLSWTVQIAKALRNGCNVLRNFRHILCNPHCNVDVKILITETYIVPAMRLGTEVWFPRTPKEKRGVARLDGVQVDSLAEAHGIARWHPM